MTPTSNSPPNVPVSPWVAFGRHYIRDFVYAANDGIVTTFAVVAGVRGANLESMIVIALGFANLAADGLSMAVGNYLGIKSEQAAHLQSRYDERVESIHAARHAGVTWISFVLAGLIPLAPFFFGLSPHTSFTASVIVTALTMFVVGAARTVITRRSAWRSGLEMLVVGALAGGAAFCAGWAVEALLTPKE